MKGWARYNDVDSNIMELLYLQNIFGLNSL